MRESKSRQPCMSWTVLITVYRIVSWKCCEYWHRQDYLVVFACSSQDNEEMIHSTDYRSTLKISGVEGNTEADEVEPNVTTGDRTDFKRMSGFTEHNKALMRNLRIASNDHRLHRMPAFSRALRPSRL
jgi:hypothetical protein